jgi:hypothetical protein
MIALTQMFARPVPAATPQEVIGWWERRRLYYNLIIFVWAAILICVLIAVGRERISWGAIASILLIYLLLFQLPANIFYTGGWIAELIVKKALRLSSARFGPFALGLGIAASLLFYLGIAAYFWVAERH